MDTKQLKQRILDLAIRGKLVPQDPNDEPASVLLERIRAEKEQLIAQGKLKKSKTKASDKPHYENVPFEIPESWEWVKLDELASYKKGPFGSSLTKAMFVPESLDTFKVYEQKNAIQKDVTLGNYFISKEHFDKLKGFEVQPNDIIVSCAGTIGETYVMPLEMKKGIINQALMYVRLHLASITPFYLIYFDTIIKSESNSDSKGTAIKNIPPFEVLKNYFFPLPPLAEQQRIVAEVEKWFALIDELEANKEDLKDYIKQVKSKVLDLAIHGKLVPQDPNDEPAIELLKRINPNFKPCDTSHYENLPQGWCTCSFKDAFDITMGSSPDGSTLNHENDGIEFHQGKINFTKKYLAPSNIYTNSPTKFGEAFSILLCVRAPVGIVNITQRKICIGRGLCTLLPKKNIDLMYAFYAMQTYQDIFETKATGTTFKAISGSTIRDEIFLLPPYTEQIRIRKKLDELWSIIDSISAEL